MTASSGPRGRQSRGVGVLLLLSLLSCVGCPYAATFRQGSLGPIGDWPPTQESRRPLVALDLDGMDPESAAYSETKRTYAECELFTIVPPGEAADVLAKVTISKKRESDYGGAVIDIFFGLIPVHQSTNIYESTSEFKFKDGKLLTITQSEQSET